MGEWTGPRSFPAETFDDAADGTQGAGDFPAEGMLDRLHNLLGLVGGFDVGPAGRALAADQQHRVAERRGDPPRQRVPVLVYHLLVYRGFAVAAAAGVLV